MPTAPEGPFVAIVTPFHDDETINEAALARQVERQVSVGNGIFCNGTNGEFFAMSSDERMQVIRICAEAAGGRVPVFAHAGAVSTHTVIKQAAEAERLGVTGISVVTPYFLNCSPEGLVSHYQAVADTVSTPLYLYNIPKLTGHTLEKDVVARLADHPQIYGIKDSSGSKESLDGFLEMAAERDDFEVFTGPDSLICHGFLNGAKGCISGLANLMPKTVNGIYKACMAGKVEEAERLQAHLGALREALYALGFSPAMVKWALFLSDPDVGKSRRPVVVSDETVSEIRKVLERFEVECLSESV